MRTFAVIFLAWTFAACSAPEVGVICRQGLTNPASEQSEDFNAYLATVPEADVHLRRGGRITTTNLSLTPDTAYALLGSTFVSISVDSISRIVLWPDGKAGGHIVTSLESGVWFGLIAGAFMLVDWNTTRALRTIRDAAILGAVAGAIVGPYGEHYIIRYCSDSE